MHYQTMELTAQQLYPWELDCINIIKMITQYSHVSARALVKIYSGNSAIVAKASCFVYAINPHIQENQQNKTAIFYISVLCSVQ